MDSVEILRDKNGRQVGTRINNPPRAKKVISRTEFVGRLPRALFTSTTAVAIEVRSKLGLVLYGSTVDLEDQFLIDLFQELVDNNVINDNERNQIFN